MSLVFAFVLFALCLPPAMSSRILVVIPTPSISHQLVFRPLTQELAKRGHQVTVITTDPAFEEGKAPENLIEINVKDVSYNKFNEKFMSTPRGYENNRIHLIIYAFNVISEITGDQLNTTAVQDIINGNHSFDLLILEEYPRTIVAFSHLFKVPVMLASTYGALYTKLEVIGAPSHPLLYPSYLTQGLTNMSIWDKLKELYNLYLFDKGLDDTEEFDHKLMEKYFGLDLPTFKELNNNVAMSLYNMDTIFVGNHPVPPGLGYIWGIHKRPEKELPLELKTYLDSSKHGVIYMSFGTNTDPSQLSPKVLNILMKVFCQLPYDVLFKWNKDELPGRCGNIKIAKWFPQSDLLKHPKVKLFVTQGGLQSTDEAIVAKVPMIGIPMLGDQWYNVAKYVHFKIGIQLSFETITDVQFKDAVLKVINDKSYRHNIEKLDRLMRDKPLSGLEQAVWSVEYVLRHGGARHLRSPAANISWAQYFELELVALVLTALVVSVTLVLFGLHFIIKLLMRGKSKTD